MNIKQQSHTKMFVAVLGVLDTFKTLWQAVTAFATARNDLAAAIADIRAEELKQSGTTTRVTENKRLARQAMCSAAADLTDLNAKMARATRPFSRVHSSWLMKARSSSPVTPCGLAAQSRQRFSSPHRMGRRWPKAG